MGVRCIVAGRQSPADNNRRGTGQTTVAQQDRAGGTPHRRSRHTHARCSARGRADRRLGRPVPRLGRLALCGPEPAGSCRSATGRARGAVCQTRAERVTRRLWHRADSAHRTPLGGAWVARGGTLRPAPDAGTARGHGPLRRTAGRRPHLHVGPRRRHRPVYRGPAPDGPPAGTATGARRGPRARTSAHPRGEDGSALSPAALRGF